MIPKNKKIQWIHEGSFHPTISLEGVRIQIKRTYTKTILFSNSLSQTPQ